MIEPAWPKIRDTMEPKNRRRQLRLDVERHRGHAAQCIHAAWFWRDQIRNHPKDIEHLESVIKRAREHSRCAQSALRELRVMEIHR